MTDSKRTLICVWGSTGTGKSSVASLLSGCYFRITNGQYDFKKNDEIFKTSSQAESFTNETRIEECKWFDGDPGLVIIDTPGLNDTQGPKKDDENIEKMVAKLKKLDRGINLFLLVFNGESRRFDHPLKLLIKLFGKIYGLTVFNNVAIVFTRWKGDEESIQDREEEFNTKNVEEEVSKQYIKLFAQETGGKEPLGCFFLDTRTKEKNASGTLDSMRLIKMLARSTEPFSCKHSQATVVEISRLSNELNKKNDEMKDIVTSYKLQMDEMSETMNDMKKEYSDKMKELKTEYSNQLNDQMQQIEHNNLKREYDDFQANAHNTLISILANNLSTSNQEVCESLYESFKSRYGKLYKYFFVVVYKPIHGFHCNCFSGSYVTSLRQYGKNAIVFYGDKSLKDKLGCGWGEEEEDSERVHQSIKNKWSKAKVVSGILCVRRYQGLFCYGDEFQLINETKQTICIFG